MVKNGGVKKLKINCVCLKNKEYLVNISFVMKNQNPYLLDSLSD